MKKTSILTAALALTLIGGMAYAADTVPTAASASTPSVQAPTTESSAAVTTPVTTPATTAAQTPVPVQTPVPAEAAASTPPPAAAAATNTTQVPFYKKEYEKVVAWVKQESQF
jgi:hypothetical protein